MTTRWKGFTVALECDIREDDGEFILNAIRAIRGVADVQPIETTSQDWIDRRQLRHETHIKLYEAIRDIFEGKR